MLTAVAAAGLIAEAIIPEGGADAVSLAGAMLQNPRWALKTAEKLGVKIEWQL